MSVKRQAGVEGYPCDLCHKKMVLRDSWTFRYQGESLITCCGDCMFKLVAAVREGE